MARARCERRPPAGRRSGFTLVELIAALAVLAVLAGLVPPAYADWIATQRLANQARHMAESMQMARSEAIKSGYRVNLCKSRDGRQCTSDGGWEDGWIMFIDDNHDGDVDVDEAILRVDPPAGDGITIRANHPVDDYLSFTSLGHARTLNGALQMGTLVVCKRGQNALNVVLANSGRIRVDKTHSRCG